MPFSFPSSPSPSVGATSTQNGRSYTYAGNNVWELTPATGGGGGTSVGGVVILPGLGDPFYSSVSLLLHGDGTNGSTTITDNSGSPKTFTISGSAAVSTARAKFGGGSLLLGSSTTVTSNSSSDFAFGTGDFTVEFWMNAATLPTSETRLVNFGGDGGDKYLNLVYGYSGNTFSIVNEVVAHVLTTSQAVSLNQWHHVAYTRSAGTLYLFFNGALLGSTSASGVNTPSTTIQLTAGNGSIYYDDFRVTRAARYTARFFPSIVAFHNSENLIAFVESGIPAAPTNLTAAAGNTQASLSWAAPEVAYPITDYVIQYQSSVNGGSTWSGWSQWTPPTPVITISSQPSNQTASGGSATFSVTASLNVSGTLGYQWQKRDGSGSTWANVSGATSSSLVLSNLTNGADDSDQYQVIVSSTVATSVTSSAATLTVAAPTPPLSLAGTRPSNLASGTTANGYTLTGTATSASPSVLRIGGGNNNDSRVWLIANQSGTLNWTVTASSESGYDGGRLYIAGSPANYTAGGFNDGTPAGYTAVSNWLSGTQTQTGTTSVTAGQHIVLRWVRDDGGDSGSDRIELSAYVSQPTTPAYIVANAGDSSYNGTYALAGTSNTANYYRITGQSRYLYWTNFYGYEVWMISNTLGLDFGGDFNGYNSAGGSSSVPTTGWSSYGTFYPGSGPTLTSTTV